MRALLPLLATALWALVQSAPAAGQRPDGWNSDRVLEIVARGRAERQRALGDSGLDAYTARARGHVYFLVDRPASGERTLVKADQLALDVYWKSPGAVRQRIVGRRDEKRLPTSIRYHLDHLTVVTDGFSDRINLGDGDEVRSVPHPLAPGSEGTYDFRLADSLTIRFPEGGSGVRAYEIEVRPRDLEQPGYLGSLFLDGSRAAVVRMRFTFTPASYVDPTLDYIRISLDNARWQGRHWLPYRQEVEIRRELPILDLPTGSVIQARWRIGDYVLDPEIAPDLFRGPAVAAVPEEEARRYPFDRGLYAELERDGLVPPPGIEEVREEAIRVIGHRYLSGLRRLRLFVPSASSVLRYNRAEGFFAGSGFSFRPDVRLGLRVHGGWAFGREEPEGTLELTGGEIRPRTGIRLTWNELADMGPRSGASGVVNSVSALALGTDYLDPYFTSGITVFHTFSLAPEVELDFRGWWAEVEGATNVVADAGSASSMRPVRPVDGGREIGLELRAAAGSEAAGPGATASLRAARIDGAEYGTAEGGVSWSRTWLPAEVELSAGLHGGVVTASAPLQSLFLLGGRGTLPGFRYRAFAGDRFWLIEAGGSWGVAAPWVRARAFGSAGSTALADHVPPGGWPGEPTDRILFSAGVGAGLLWDVIHVDVARGLNGGSWELDVFVSRRFRSWL